MDKDLRALPVGEVLLDFKILSKLGQGAFGITYLAQDLSLDCKVAIKEYFPREFAVREGTKTVRAGGAADERETFNWGLAKFSEEAQTLARLDHPNVVAVRRFFKLNGTAYLVMDYCEGEPLDRVIRKDGTPSPERLEQIFLSLLDALEYVHSQKVTHRDIKPSNIFIRNDGRPVLLDFGAAKRSLVEQTHTVTSLATRHYAAFEQYATNGKQGPWTDVYGLAATMYFVATGVKPEDSSDRILDDTLTPLRVKAATKYPQRAAILSAIDAGMGVRQNERPQTVADWKKLVKSPRGVAAPPPPAPPPPPQQHKMGQDREVSKPITHPKEPNGGIWVGTVFFGFAALLIFIIAGAASNSPPTSASTETSAAPVSSEGAAVENAPASAAPSSSNVAPQGMTRDPSLVSPPTPSEAPPTPVSIPKEALDAVVAARGAESRAIQAGKTAREAAASLNCPMPSSSYWDNCNGETNGYAGSWSRDRPSGYGVSTDGSGTYSGQHLGPLVGLGADGYGVLKYADESVFRGHFANNNFDGYGIFYGKDNHYELGAWSNGILITGQKYNPDGSILAIWVDGSLVGP